MIEDLYLNFSIPAWIIFLISWLFIAIAFFFYTRTLPPLSNRRKTILIAVRTMNFIILISLIFQPVLHYILQKREYPTLALLFDNSNSMKITESYGQRGDSLHYVLRRIKSDWPKDSVIIRTYSFSQDIHLLSGDSLDFRGTRTNIANALSSVRDSLVQYNIRSIILFSDGLFNEGANPFVNIKDSSIPISTITVGDTLPKKDIEITDLRYNPVVYAGDSVSLSVNLSQTGFQPGKVIVRLRGASGQIAAKSLTLPPSGFQKSVEFIIAPQEAGEFSFQVEVQSFPNEITTRNNNRQFILRVLKSKHKILLISGQPSFDQRILIHVLQQLPDMQVTVLSENRRGRFYEPDIRMVDPDSQDLFIYLGYPTSQSDKNFLNSMLSSIQKNKIPLLLMFNEKSVLSNLKPLQDILPVDINSQTVPINDAMIRLSATGLLHPAIRIQEVTRNLSEWWRDLPPVTSFGRGLEVKGDVSILVRQESIKEKEQFPLLLATGHRESKTILFAMSDFAGWHLQLQDDPERESFFKNMMSQIIRWLVSREDLQRIHIRPNRSVYRLGELVEFSGQVFDEFYREVDDAEVDIVLEGDSLRIEDVVPNQGGYYAFRTANIPSGIYKYNVKATSDGRFLGSVRGKVAIEQLELEWQETVANMTLMQQLAVNTGGRHWRINEFLNSMNQFKFKEQIQFLSHELVLWNKYYWLIAIILLLSLEWFLRKRWGLL
jgi:hypothetical protein